MQPSIENLDVITPKKKPRAVSTFLKKTFQLLSVELSLIQEPQTHCCVRWAPSGVGFIVTNEDLFSKTVLPKYFKHSNYSSFVRQVTILLIYSWTCIIFIKFGKQILRVISFTKTLIARTSTNQIYLRNAMSEIKRKP